MPGDLSRHRELRATAVKPNYGEACRLLGERERSEPRSRAAQMASQGPRLLELTGARIAAVTLDTEGAFIFERDRPPYRTYARPQNHSRCAGAGDTFVGALALALAAGAGTPAAADLASAAAAVVVGKDGTSACSADELRASLLVGGQARRRRRASSPPGSRSSGPAAGGSSSPTAASTSSTAATSPT